MSGSSRPEAASGPPAFDVCGPLPRGVTVLEASAGTGKTFTIAALVARYVASGRRLDELLVITFTRMATGELRERVRERLASAERGLTAALAGVAPDPADEVLALLARGDAAALDQRRRRLGAALADFDAATISTTHGFCQHVLGSLGVAGDVERDITFLDDPRDLIDEVVADLYVRRFAGSSEAPALTLDEARRIARVAVGNPLAPLEPAGEPRTTPEGLRRSLGEAVRAEVEQRKRRLRVLTYDDLLTRLAETLRHPVRGPAAAARLRERYRIALVDEFQDTDPIQWEIMRRAFADGAEGTDRALVLIGDPKQAIYAFRGADVHAYLDARRQAGAMATLGRNWRSDQGLIDAYDALFGGARLGHEAIEYRTVEAAEGHRARRLGGAPDDTPLRIRVLPRDGTVALTDRGFVSNAPGREHIAADLAGDVVRLLASGAALRDEPEEDWRPVRPGDVAVLVRTHKHAALVRDALDAVDVPAVISGAGSVFQTPAARAWLRLLEALERPTSPTRTRAAALTPFLGWSAERTALASEGEWEDVHARLHRWADVLRRRGVASLLEAVTVAEGVPGRVLAERDGERSLTDLRHVGQLLHAAATGEGLGVTALAAWLRRRIAEAGTETASEERSRRLESDAEAVQVLTIHRSKGLEFPIVYFPFLWEPSWIDAGDPAIYHEPDADGRLQRTIDVGMGSARAFREHRDRYVAEQRGEELRLLYVALTRAKHQAVLWWAGSWNSRESSLCRLLFARDETGDVATVADRPPEDADVLDVLGALVAESAGCVGVETATGADGAAWSGTAASAGVLEAARLERELDRTWRRASYSSITAGAHEPRVASEAEEPVVDDEALPASVALPAPQGLDPEQEAALRAVPSLLVDMPGGVDVGTFVHRVLEHTDFAATPLSVELSRAVAAEQARRSADVGPAGVLVDGLAAALATPLGPLAGDRPLRSVARGDRLDELWFELPLAGGDEPTGSVDVAAIAALLSEHLPADDPLAAYPAHLAEAAPLLRSELRGYLAGSLDLVLRLPGEAGEDRFLVADHKTSWLGADGEPLSAFHYRPAALTAAMQRAHYPLQALLYVVALHRYLRWRLPRYSPQRHLGGVLYLFLRGMTGEDPPRVDGQPCGVFAWQPPVPLVEAVSELLDRGAP